MALAICKLVPLAMTYLYWDKSTLPPEYGGLSDILFQKGAIDTRAADGRGEPAGAYPAEEDSIEGATCSPEGVPSPQRPHIHGLDGREAEFVPAGGGGRAGDSVDVYGHRAGQTLRAHDVKVQPPSVLLHTHTAVPGSRKETRRITSHN